MKEIINKIIELRKELHANPEISLHEDKTREILKRFIRNETNLEIVDYGSWFYAVKHGNDENPIAFRADHDAVEGSDGTPSHRCGHDGHSAALCGLALYLSSHTPKRTVYLIFQPAEEIGAGALFCAPLIKEKGIKEIYGFHNLPGFPKNEVILRHHTFACASTGLKIHVKGAIAHAAYPETGKNPALMISTLVQNVEAYVRKPHQGVVQNATIGIDLGSKAYGVSAFEGELRLTVRGEYQNEFDDLVNYVHSQAEQLAVEGGFSYTFEEIERFPSTENNPQCADKIVEICKENHLSYQEATEPIRWSEDFGYYLQQIPGCFFGIGDGEDYPQVHTESFEFPDDIFTTVLTIYQGLLKD